MSDPQRLHLPASVVIERRIEWPDTDAAGHWHYSTTFRLVEAAETVLHERLGTAQEAIPRMPRVHLDVSFTARLFYGDLVAIALRVNQVGRSSLTYAFDISRDATSAASGTMTVVWMDLATGRAEPWPERIRKALTESGPQEPERLVREPFL